MYKEARVHFDRPVLLSPGLREKIVRILADRLEAIEHLDYGKVLHLRDCVLEHDKGFGQEELAVVRDHAEELLQKTCNREW